MEKVKIKKTGVEYGVRLPKSIVNEMGLHEDDELYIRLLDGNVVLSREKKNLMTLAEMFADYDGPTEQEEFWDDGPVGREIL